MVERTVVKRRGERECEGEEAKDWAPETGGCFASAPRAPLESRDSFIKCELCFGTHGFGVAVALGTVFTYRASAPIVLDNFWSRSPPKCINSNS